LHETAASQISVARSVRRSNDAGIDDRFSEGILMVPVSSFIATVKLALTVRRTPNRSKELKSLPQCRDILVMCSAFQMP
jgi:hypothetical protein